jgi:hypothetical protein
MFCLQDAVRRMGRSPPINHVDTADPDPAAAAAGASPHRRCRSKHRPYAGGTGRITSPRRPTTQTAAMTLATTCSYVYRVRWQQMWWRRRRSTAGRTSSAELMEWIRNPTFAVPNQAMTWGKAMWSFAQSNKCCSSSRSEISYGDSHVISQ